MKIATFNLRDLFGEGSFDFYGGKREHTPEFVQKRIDALSETIKHMDSDLLFVQEVASESVLKRIAQQTETGYDIFIARPDKRGISNAVLYKSKGLVCSSVASLGPLPIFNDGDKDTYGTRLESELVRDFVHVEGTFQGNPLYILGVHLKSSLGISKKATDGSYEDVGTQLDAADAHIRSRLYQFSQARRLREIIDGLFAKDADAQIMVLGDFNAEENDDTLRIIKGKSKKHSGLLMNVCEDIPTEQRFSFVGGGRKKLIDHVLISASLRDELQSTTILNDNMTDQTIDDGQTLVAESDHAPILVNLAS